jgi:hypothetical protein
MGNLSGKGFVRFARVILGDAGLIVHKFLEPMKHDSNGYRRRFDLERLAPMRELGSSHGQRRI